MLVNWDNSLTTGFDTVDQQHKILVQIVNKLHKTMLEGDGSKFLHDSIIFLVKYSEIHFATEEKYMETYSYPEIIQHKQQHQEFNKFVEKLKLAAFKENIDHNLVISVFKNLVTWYVDHICKSDIKLGSYLKQCNAVKDINNIAKDETIQNEFYLYG